MNLSELNDWKKFEQAGIKALIPNEKIILYKYISGEIAEKILENKQIMFSEPSNFNDPFDINQLREWLYRQNSMDDKMKGEILRDCKNNPEKVKAFF